VYSRMARDNRGKRKGIVKVGDAASVDS